MGNAMKFRIWCREMWFQHMDECLAWEGHEPTATPQEYFNKYKYWLKREYRHQQGEKNGS